MRTIRSPRSVLLIASALAFSFSHTAFSQQRLSVTCEQLVGNRVSYADNPLAGDDNRKIARVDDSIEGARIRLIVDIDAGRGLLLEMDNRNTGGRPATLDLAVVRAAPFLSLAGVDALNGGVNLISYFPTTNHVIWSIHNDRILFIDRVSLAKQFIGRCRLN